MDTYIVAKRVIENTTYKVQSEKDKMQFKLDIFLLNDRLNQDEYNELTLLLINKPVAE